MGSIVMINDDNCIGCGVCANVCKSGILQLDEAAGKMRVTDESKCQKDGACMDECPSDGIKINK